MLVADEHAHAEIIRVLSVAGVAGAGAGLLTGCRETVLEVAARRIVRPDASKALRARVGLDRRGGGVYDNGRGSGLERQKCQCDVVVNKQKTIETMQSSMGSVVLGLRDEAKEKEREKKTHSRLGNRGLVGQGVRYRGRRRSSFGSRLGDSLSKADLRERRMGQTLKGEGRRKKEDAQWESR